MTAIETNCLWCGEELPFDAKSTIKYCGVNHRTQAYKQRLRDKAANLARFQTTDRRLASRRDDYDPGPPIEPWTPPPMPPIPEPELLDDIDRWFRTPLRPD